MTKEQAIEVLHELDGSLYETQQVALDMAIKALEQQTNDCKIFGTKENCFGGATENECEHCDYKIQKLEQQPSDDCVSRTQAIEWIENLRQMDKCFGNYEDDYFPLSEVIDRLKNVPPVTPTQSWVPISEKLPNDLEPVNITWINHNPESYYANIKDKPFTATGVYFNGQWYWWTTTCTDILAEYSCNYDEIIDTDIEIIAWQPLPQPYEEKRGNESIGWN